MINSFFEELRIRRREGLSMFFPQKCLACRKEGHYLCAKHDALPSVPRNEVVFSHIDHVQACTAYYHVMSKKVVEYLKFRGFQSVGTLMAKKMIAEITYSFWHNAVLIPVPLHWTRKFWRGFNQADILAREIQKLVPEITLSHDLKRIKRTSQQAKLSKTDRVKNMQDVFIWKSKKSVPARVILIDDVVASGSTLDSAGEVLKKAGVKTVDAVVFARGGGRTMNN